MRRFVVALACAATAFGAAAAFSQSTPAAPTPSPSPGGMIRADANGDGIVTRAEAIAQADAQFDAMDTDHDGKVTGEEMRAAFAARGGGGMGNRFGGGGAGDLAMTREAFRDRALSRFERNDLNHDGQVDQAEMAQARAMRMNRPADGSAPAPQQ